MNRSSPYAVVHIRKPSSTFGNWRSASFGCPERAQFVEQAFEALPVASAGSRFVVVVVASLVVVAVSDVVEEALVGFLKERHHYSCQVGSVVRI